MSTRTLTVEQQFIVQQARPPIDTWPKGWCHFQAKKPSGRVVVTIAGPGSGKTTVQEDLIASLLAKGHRHVLKIFFNKGAAEDAKDRLIRRLGSHDAEKVECITSHKAAKDFVKAELTPGGPPVYERCKLTEEQLKTKIQKLFASGIEAWVGRNPQSQEERKKANREARLVTHWIFKTFLQFLGSKKPLAKLQGGHPDYDYETYYPAKMQHKEKLPCCRNQKPGNWYKERAYELWTRMRNDPDFPITHDVYLKWAQLERNLNLSRFTAILVDEAQDMSEAQLDAFVGQQAHADCFVVGDMAQSLYSWRYASPQQLASLPVPDKLQGKWFYTLGGLIHQQVQQRQREPTVETKLTQTFRFGSKIAAVANGMLQIKEESQQSEAKKPLWVPYRVVSAPGKSPGVVTTDELAFPYTVIARSNAALVVHAWELWGLLDGATGGTSAGGVRTSADGGRIKIALLNEGDVGGKKPFSTIFKEINDALCLYHGKPLPDKSKFEEYDSWEDFLQQVEDLELNEFTTLIQLVERHGKDNEGSKLKDLIEEFKEAVLGKDKCSVAEADVVLTTVCGSKGLEWPRVQLLNDCVDLNFVAPGEGSFKGSMVFAPQRPPSQKRGHPRLDFTGDELNSWFVATTRAQEELRLPRLFYELHSAAVSSDKMGLSGYPPPHRAPTHLVVNARDAPDLDATQHAQVNGLLDRLGTVFRGAGVDLMDRASVAAEEGAATPRKRRFADIHKAPVPSAVADDDDETIADDQRADSTSESDDDLDRIVAEARRGPSTPGTPPSRRSSLSSGLQEPATAPSARKKSRLFGPEPA